jgi:hypothetical protein
MTDHHDSGRPAPVVRIWVTEPLKEQFALLSVTTWWIILRDDSIVLKSK